jgi:DNA-binding NtrC family response regulator
MWRVLIMDDEPQLLRLYRSLFEGQGFEVLAADTVEGAVRLQHDCAPDVIIADVAMSDGGALQLLKIVGPACPILVNTGGAAQSVAAVARHLGAAGVLQKIDGSVSLLAAVRRVLGDGMPG